MPERVRPAFDPEEPREAGEQRFAADRSPDRSGDRAGASPDREAPRGGHEDPAGEERGSESRGPSGPPDSGGSSDPGGPSEPGGPSRPPGSPEGPRRPGLPGAGRSFRTLSLWLLIALAAIVVVQQLYRAQSAGNEVSYSDFWQAVQEKRVEEVTIVRRDVTGKYRESAEGEVKRFHTYLPNESDPLLLEALRAPGEGETPRVRIQSKPDPTPWFSVLLSWLPFILLIGVWFFMIRQMQSGGSAALKFGKSRAKLLHEHKARVTFDHVAGADEAKQELEEIIEFLRSPRKFRRLGGRIPKGVLLVGPPGTGKTLLARAVAGEANVPFFSISGSDFVEMFVGVGAARVRDLFEQGKRHAPCIVFVDELDAVGRHRGAGLGGGHDEREQTLNQLLVEMDGFDANEGVILLSATNRPDVLDPALLRPGRFDRVVVVDRPDVRGREGILKVHCRNKPLAPDVDLSVLARATPGLSGADLENIVNEAALLGARSDREAISMLDMEEAKDKVMMGTERRSLVIPDAEKEATAYHEAGHALVVWNLPEADPLHKVTIIPRGQALGLTHSLPTEDRYTRSREYLEQMLAGLMAGRAAEELVFQRFTTGASNDISRATQVARKMVCSWGMSETLGPIQFGSKDELIFLGKEISQQKDYSERTAQLIDAEVNRIISTAYRRARDILQEHLADLHLLAKSLLERESLDREEVAEILAGGALGAEPGAASNTASNTAPGAEPGAGAGDAPQADAPAGTPASEDPAGGS